MQLLSNFVRSRRRARDLLARAGLVTLAAGACATVAPTGAPAAAAAPAAVSRSVTVPGARSPSLVRPGDGRGLSAAPALMSACRGPAGWGQQFLGSVWPGGFRGVPVYSNGVSGSFTSCLHATRTPAGRLVTDGYEWQCVELVVRLYLAKGWISSSWLGNGNRLYSTAPGFLSRQPQGRITFLHPGDVVSLDDPWGGAGHAAVVSRVQGSLATIVNQNTDRAAMISYAHLVGGRLVMVGWPGWQPVGVVHAPYRAPVAPLRIASGSLPAARVDDGYDARLSAEGGAGHDRWSVAGGSLPAGLTLSSAGTVSGTPLVVGRTRFVAVVRDSKRAVTRRTVSLPVSSHSDLLSNPTFSARGTRPWRALAGGAVVRTRHAVPGVPASAGRGSELVLSSRRAGGSVYQDTRAELFVGHSVSFGVWVRSLQGSSRGPGTPGTAVCVAVWALPHVQGSHTCAVVSTRWAYLVAPYDVGSRGERVLRAQVYLRTAGARIALADAGLSGNALRHASFRERKVADWRLHRPVPSDSVSAEAAVGGGLPEGQNFLSVASSAPGGAVYQDVKGRLPAGQSYRFSAWLRARSGGGGRSASSGATACVILAAVRTGGANRRCLRIGQAWTKVVLPYEVNRSGAAGLRASVAVLSPRQTVEVDGTQLVNSGS